MVYSVIEWPRMRSAAEAEGFEALVWWASDLTGDEVAAAAEMAGWSDHEMARVAPVPAECAGVVGRANHYPYSRVLDRGTLHAWPIWGVMPNPAWLDSLRWRLHSLRQSMEGPPR